MKKKIVAVIGVVVITTILLSTSAAAEEGVSLQMIYDILMGTNEKLDSIEQRVAELEVKREVSVTDTPTKPTMQELFKQVDNIVITQPRLSMDTNPQYDENGLTIGLDAPVEPEIIFLPENVSNKFKELASQEVAVNFDREEYIIGDMIEVRGKANSESVGLVFELNGQMYKEYTLYLHADGTFGMVLGTGDYEPGVYDVTVTDKDIVVTKRITILGH